MAAAADIAAAAVAAVKPACSDLVALVVAAGTAAGSQSIEVAMAVHQIPIAAAEGILAQMLPEGAAAYSKVRRSVVVVAPSAVVVASQSAVAEAVVVDIPSA